SSVTKYWQRLPQLLLIHCLIALLAGSWLVTAQQQGRSHRVIIPDSNGQGMELYDECHALVIGVSNYTNGWPRLRRVKLDVERVSETLRRHGFEVETLHDPDGKELDSRLHTF